MSTIWDIREMLNRMYPQTRRTSGRCPTTAAAQTDHEGNEHLRTRFPRLGNVRPRHDAPDTFVKARDALIIADQMLYPSDATDPDAPGKHRAMIEQIFAAKEIGVNAVEVTGGKATISTQVTPFVGNQAAPAVPPNVVAAPASPKSIKVTWNGVSGALAYEVLKRKTAYAGRREPNGKRDFFDGDSSTTGYRHVAYVDGNQLFYEDKGPVHEMFSPTGITNLFDSEYVVRAIGVNSTGQLGWSDLSGSSQASQVRQDLTSQVDSAISNISFASGVMSFDNTLTNARGGAVARPDDL